MSKSSYGYSKKVNATFDEALERTKQGLKKEDFSVLTEIDKKHFST